MKKRNKRFDALQRQLFRQGKAVDYDWFEEWLKQQLGERTEMPSGDLLWSELTRLDVGFNKGFSVMFINEGVVVRPKSQNEVQTPSNVPKRAEIFLLFVLPKKIRETLPADLAEEFRDVIIPKMGFRLAHFWYWWQVLRAIPWVWFVAVYELMKAKFGF